jgi:PhoPQ-activated pathogenicity-related protein
VHGTALDDYIAKPDSSYAWVDTGLTMEGVGWKGYILNMTSQTWLTPADWHHENPSPNVWWHWMLVIVPNELVSKYPTSLMWVTGGSNRDSPPHDPEDEDVVVTATLACNLGLIATALYQIPNQPIYFNDELPTPRARSEDAMIAWTWQHFLNNPTEPEWIARLPMTKAVVRAMDTVQNYLKLKQINIDNFIVAGASKRGWTTWTTGAVDKRILAIVPIVMDELNFVKNIHHHFDAYGGWSFALEDYYVLNFTKHLDDPVLVQLMAIEDPYMYLDRMTYPKMVINAGGDEFFLPDDTRWWWDKCPEPKHFLMIPNAEHSLATGIIEAIESVEAFANGVLQKVTQPEFTWTIDNKTGDITVTCKQTPDKVSLWYAESATGTGRRDYRLVAGYPNTTLQLVLWTEVPVTATSPGVYVGHRTMPTVGWTAFFMDVRYTGPESLQGPTEFRATSEVSIIPNTFPFTCSGESCYGHLL